MQSTTFQEIAIQDQLTQTAFHCNDPAAFKGGWHKLLGWPLRVTILAAEVKVLLKSRSKLLAVLELKTQLKRRNGADLEYTSWADLFG